MSAQDTRQSWDSVASSFKIVWARWRHDDRNNEHHYVRSDDEDSDLAEETKLLEAAMTDVERSRSSLQSYACTVSLIILLLVSGSLGYLLVACQTSPKDGSTHNAELKNSIKPPAEHVTVHPRKALVVASWSSQNVTWLSEISKDWEVYRYILDDPNPASLHSVPRNQGRETMAYLTFIVDHYDNLPDFTVFVHGHDRSWHQLEPLPLKLSALNLTALSVDNYVNLRCTGNPGCSQETYISATRVRDGESRIQAILMPAFWRTMFPATSDYWGLGPPPHAIGVPCCAQFAVTKAAIRLRSSDFWKMYRTPLTRDLEEYEELIGEGLSSYTIGMLYEKVWHIVFGKDAIYCPNEEYCHGVQWSNAITCDRYTGDFLDSIGWENITCGAAR